MIPKFTELTEEQINVLGADELRNAYRALRDHHIAETSALWNKVENLRRLSSKLSGRK